MIINMKISIFSWQIPTYNKLFYADQWVSSDKVLRDSLKISCVFFNPPPNTHTYKSSPPFSGELQELWGAKSWRAYQKLPKEDR